MFSLPSPSSALKVPHYRVLPTGVEPRTLWLPTSPDALPLSYRRLMEATKGHKTELIWQTFWFVCLFLKVVACEQALLLGRAKRAARERTSERRTGEGTPPAVASPLVCHSSVYFSRYPPMESLLAGYQSALFSLSSHADVLRALSRVCWGGLHDKPKERLRGRLSCTVVLKTLNP